MLPKLLKDFNAFIDGGSYVGRATDIQLPKLARKMVDYEGAGIGPIEIDMGADKLTAEITLAEYSREVLNTYGISTVDGVGMRFLQARSSDDSDSGTDAVEIVVRGRFKEIDLGSLKRGDNTPMKLMASLTYFKYIVNGEVVIEIDLLSQIFTVNGIDRNAALRNALAL